MASGEPACFALFCTHMKCLFAWGAILALGTMTCLFLLPSTFAQNTQYRTVIDKEVGAMYQNPVGFPWSAFGVFIGSPQSLDPDAARVLLAHFDKFSPGESTQALGFPYSTLRSYEAQQIANGKPGIFVTATYMGKKRPVLFAWTLGLKNGKPTSPPGEWQYAVNVQDTRFIHFWINHYIQPLLAKYQKWQSFGPNLWFQLDQCAFIYNLFGVLDDSNNFVAGVTWDSPFPQSQAAYETGIKTFFSQVKTQLAPNITTIANIGSQADPSHIPALFADVSGSMFEDLYGWHYTPSSYVRNLWYTGAFQYFPWMASQGKVAITRAILPFGDSKALLQSFVVYSLLKGSNFFFAPGDSNGATDPARWSGMKAVLGKPLSAVQASQPSLSGNGYRLFWRDFEGGRVYLNWTGAAQTIALDSQHKYYDPYGNVITKVVIPDATGTYVSTATQALPAPRIRPRYGLQVVAPLLVSIESDITGAAIRYTVDGSKPTASSPLYSGPFLVASSTVVNATAFSGNQSSFSATASYSVSSSPLTVQFNQQADQGPGGSYYPVLALSAIPTGTVEVKYTVQNGTPATGSYTFLPGHIYGILPVTTPMSGSTTVNITDAIGATLGQNHTLRYTAIQ
jgi:hypothetical protein